MAFNSLIQKEGQEDQETFKQLGGGGPSSFTSPWSSWPSFWLWALWKSINRPQDKLVSQGVILVSPRALMAGQEYKQRAEYKQIWQIHIGIPSKTSQNPQKQAPKICLKSACIPTFSLTGLA
jgi:hypothetical protein